jgi:hypothetical protein
VDVDVVGDGDGDGDDRLSPRRLNLIERSVALPMKLVETRRSRGCTAREVHQACDGGLRISRSSPSPSPSKLTSTVIEPSG